MSDPANATQVFRALLEALQQRRPCVLTTVVSYKGSTPRKGGAKMLVFENGDTVGTIGGGAAEHAVVEYARNSVHADGPIFLDKNLTRDLGMNCGGAISVLIEPQTHSPRLLLFGAGHIAQPLARIASMADFDVVVIDDRAEQATEERFPNAKIILVENPVDTLDDLQMDAEHTYVIVVTYNHSLDEEIAAAVLKRPFRFLGVIGSRRKREVFCRHLEAAGIESERVQQMQMPVGLDIDAETPAEIAISIVSELIRVRRGDEKSA